MANSNGFAVAIGWTWATHEANPLLILGQVEKADDTSHLLSGVANEIGIANVQLHMRREVDEFLGQSRDVSGP